MRKSPVIFLLMPLLVSASPLQAAEPPKLTIEAGPEVSSITYKEPGFMEEKGIFYGLRLATTYRPTSKIVLGAEGRISTGMADYSGSFKSDYSDARLPAQVENIDNNILEFRLKAGYSVPLSSTVSVTPYIGFGYRKLTEEGDGRYALGQEILYDAGGTPHLLTSIGYGNDREQKYYYTPIGIDANTPLGNGWSVGLNLEYDYFWAGRNLTAHTVEFKQDDGYGLRGAVRLERASDIFDLVIEPYINYWHIDDSERIYYYDPDTDTLYSAREPENSSTEFGLRLQFKGVR